MPKIQGKQIADETITQNLLNLTTPTSGDTRSAATVEYVNNYMESIVSDGVTIGPAEDGVYTDGVFTDFVPTTRIGVAIDKINEFLLKIAPAPPSDFSSTTMAISATTYTPRQLTTGAVLTSVSPMITVITPTFNVTIPTNGLLDAETGILTFDVDNTIQETYNIIGETSKTTGIIRFTAGDPYLGVAGKSDIWFGFKSLSAISTTLTAGSTMYSAHYNHNVGGTLTRSFYIDTPLAVTIANISASTPNMTRWVSGVPSLKVGDIISEISFDINNVSSYFYASGYVWEIVANIVAQVSGDPDIIPTLYGASGAVTSKQTTVLANKFNDLVFTFGVRGRNSINSNGIEAAFTDNSKRVDTVSDESKRVTSGFNSYPATGYNQAYDSTKSLLTDYSNELMLKNGVYQYPNGDYSTLYGYIDTAPIQAPDYSAITTGIRWVTFNLGVFNNNSAFTLNFSGSTGINTIYGSTSLRVEIKIEGSKPSYWIDGDTDYAVGTNPGESSDGLASVVVGSSTATSRRITFGTKVYTGNIIVRIGLTGADIRFTGLTATAIV